MSISCCIKVCCHLGLGVLCCFAKNDSVTLHYENIRGRTVREVDEIVCTEGGFD